MSFSVRFLHVFAFCCVLLWSQCGVSDVQAGTVAASGLYSQPRFTLKELQEFVVTLPDFRTWVKSQNEKVAPMVDANKMPGFSYSPAAADWLRAHRWNPERFFCVMGRTAAAVALIGGGDDLSLNSPDMPVVSSQELKLVRQMLPQILDASSMIHRPGAGEKALRE